MCAAYSLAFKSANFCVVICHGHIDGCVLQSLKDTMVKALNLPGQLLQDYCAISTRMSRVMAALRLTLPTVLSQAGGLSQLQTSSTDTGSEEQYGCWESCMRPISKNRHIVKVHSQ